MNHGICALSVVPVRAEPADKAEIVTQLIFGDCYTVLQTQGNWQQIRTTADNYVGWMDPKQHQPVTAEYLAAWSAQDHPRSLDVVQVVSNAQVRIPVTIGARLPFFDGMTLRLGEENYFYNGAATNPQNGHGLQGPIDKRLALLLKAGHIFLKAPYLWGGRSLFGIDCSGLVQQLYGLIGVQLPRDARQQIDHGRTVHFVSQTQPGDLAFFDNAEGNIVHVGLLLEDQQILHASGEVRIDPLDHNGIFNRQRQKYSHKLRLIKRILAD
ncbi:C40 family peptidase [Hymenobacter cellulosilyticus]|uniref:C40 family peptidase n=1 Tax=Hymenobacter cellulosilyticus TaxID=2932248 RepID=A0A8T9Q3F1_9BACT|nr:C40 family peptidase [Hymenobacter cellulosilyticus]UOQ71997.1 C40 family peptidase [Hymenobacter cellulosilyticus]